MKLIVGLGNPGEKYENTKHNIGFLTIDQIYMDLKNETYFSSKSKFNAFILEGKIHNEKVLLVKPLTYMNLSGEAVEPLLNWYHLSVDDLLIVYDDLDLPLGKIRLREKGSSGGHNGIKSIIEHLNTDQFKRMKIGIGRPKDNNIVDYVLSPFRTEEFAMIKESLHLASQAIQEWITGREFRKVMSQYN
ncbi:aminoacyl-tRNA hydrolase [Tepidibacillus fermentans]|uniref:Peptidyl-tRNA hydrolase n=1 Tax=Tepidibacillus fermentans TaxID=1281767 RepID=A0A4R3KB23_9BACI|nr:aminoacyl-tRNA hydrolase [Tepidibacillus fermentans]TCS80163.1 peptidyl-tRNA hydrolase [Tepidibacillus fermentans]